MVRSLPLSETRSIPVKRALDEMADRSPPLEGLRIVNTRAAHQAPALTRRLEAAGATVVHYPAIRIEPVPEIHRLDRALEEAIAGKYAWLVVTSTNTVHILAQRLAAGGHTGQDLVRHSLRVAAVGPATAQEIRERLGLQVDVLPQEHVAEALAQALEVRPGERVLLPQSAIARPVLAERLRAMGAEVTALPVYRTLLGHGGEPLPEYLWEGTVDAVTFTSASTVHRFLQRLKRENGSPGMLVDVVAACIGPITAEAARRHDLPVRVVAQEHTLDGLVQALVAYYRGERP